MATTTDQAQKLAALGNTLRPDWKPGALLTFITQELKNRTFREIAIALAYIGTDPEIRTPGVLREPGPWWEAARPIAPAASGGHGKCDNCGIFHSPQSPCNIRQLRSDRRNQWAAYARADLHTRHGGAPTTEGES